MIPFERWVVSSLTTTSDPELRHGVADFVDGSLRAMPTHLRAGVLGESVILGTWVKIRSWGRRDDAVLQARLAAWEAHPVDLIRQYVRVFGSLVLFAEIELPDAAARSAPTR